MNSGVDKEKLYYGGYLTSSPTSHGLGPSSSVQGSSSSSTTPSVAASAVVYSPLTNYYGGGGSSGGGANLRNEVGIVSLFSSIYAYKFRRAKPNAN